MEEWEKQKNVGKSESLECARQHETYKLHHYSADKVVSLYIRKEAGEKTTHDA